MSGSREKIAITGSGIVCGAGASVSMVWDALEKGESAIGPIQQWDADKWPVKNAAEVKENNRTLVSDRKLHKTISRTDMFGIYASEKAIENSGLPAFRESLAESEVDRFNDRTGMLVGSGGGNYLDNYDYFPLMTETDCELKAFGEQLSSMVTPMWLLKNLPNNVLCHVGIRNQLKGTNACITNQCVSGLMAVAESAAAIRNGEADRIVAAGHDSPLEPEMVYYYHRLGLMSEDVVRPFDRNRDGTIFGEGSGAVVLEKFSEAEERGSEILGEYLGFGCCSEATGVLDLEASGEGVARAIEEALSDSGLEKEDVGMICAHGNGTVASDLTEALAIRNVFGDSMPPVTSFKWAYGHLIAASGIVDFVMTLEALKQQKIPGVATLEEIDSQISPLSISRETVAPLGKTALVICRGFGGMNVVTAIRSV